MASLTIVFWIYVFLFAVIGAMRRWAREAMVTFSLIVAIFLIIVMETYIGPVKTIVASADKATTFWLRTSVVILMVFFGYQTPTFRRWEQAKQPREHMQDILLGFVLGALNGFLIIGSLWFYMHLAGYPYPSLISSPNAQTTVGQAALRLVGFLPPAWLVIPWVYFAVGLSFAFVLIVFI